MTWTATTSASSTWSTPNKYIEITPVFKFDTHGNGFDVGKFGHTIGDGGSVFWSKTSRTSTTWTVS